MSKVVVAGDAPAWAADLARQINQAIATSPVLPKQYTVATVPSAAANKGHIIRVTNGDTGNPCLALSDGTNWKRIVLGANIST